MLVRFRPARSVSGGQCERCNRTSTMKRLAANTKRRRLLYRSLPWPAAFDFEHQCPTEEGSDDDQTGEHREAHGGELDRDGLDDIGSHQHLEAEQQRLAAARPRP